METRGNTKQDIEENETCFNEGYIFLKQSDKKITEEWEVDRAVTGILW